MSSGEQSILAPDSRRRSIVLHQERPFPFLHDGFLHVRHGVLHEPLDERVLRLQVVRVPRQRWNQGPFAQALTAESHGFPGRGLLLQGGKNIGEGLDRAVPVTHGSGLLLRLGFFFQRQLFTIREAAFEEGVNTRDDPLVAQRIRRKL